MHKEDVLWRLIQGGISKNWFGYGATSLYGEYGAVTNAGADITNAAGTIMGRDYRACEHDRVHSSPRCDFDRIESLGCRHCTGL